MTNQLHCDRDLFAIVLSLPSNLVLSSVKYLQRTTRNSLLFSKNAWISWRKKIYKESLRFSKYWHMYTFTLDSRDFHDMLQNWSTVTTFEIRAPRIETWNRSKLLLLYFFFSIFNIQIDSFVFSRWMRNFVKKKKKKETPFISRIKLKFLIFQYISLVFLLSSLVKRIFSCKFLMCNTDGISHEHCYMNLNTYLY